MTKKHAGNRWMGTLAVFVLGVAVLTGCGAGGEDTKTAGVQKNEAEQTEVTVTNTRKGARINAAAEEMIKVESVQKQTAKTAACGVSGCTIENCDGSAHRREPNCGVSGCTIENCDGSAHRREPNCGVSGCTIENCDGSTHHREPNHHSGNHHS